MRIAVICYKGFGADGISSFIINNYQYFDHSRISCSIIFPIVIGDREIAQRHLDNFCEHGDEYIEISKKQGLFRYCESLLEYLKEGHFDAAYIHGSSCSIAMEMIIAKLAGVKHIIPHSHNTTGNHIWIHKMLMPLVNHLADLRLGCGNEACKWMYGKANYTVIPNGINISNFRYNESQRQDIRKSLKINDDDIVIGHVGGFNEQKNHPFLVQVFAEIRKRRKGVKLLSIGRGHTQLPTQELAKKLGVYDDIIFLGQRTDVPQLLQAMDVFFLPSLFEGFPIVAIEAQASGLPTIMADTVAREVSLTDLALYLPIDRGTKCWVEAFEKVLEHKKDRGQYMQILKDKGFDISASSALLQEILFKLS